MKENALAQYTYIYIEAYILSSIKQFQDSFVPIHVSFNVGYPDHGASCIISFLHHLP